MEVSGQLHAPTALPLKERAPATHWIGGWVGPRAVLDAVVKRKIPSPHRDSNPRTPIVQPVAQRYTDWVITAVWARRHGFKSHQWQWRDSLFFFATASKPILGPTHPSIQRVLRNLSLGVKLTTRLYQVLRLRMHTPPYVFYQKMAVVVFNKTQEVLQQKRPVETRNLILIY
jgi:hypothetical protein